MVENEAAYSVAGRHIVNGYLLFRPKSEGWA